MKQYVILSRALALAAKNPEDNFRDSSVVKSTLPQGDMEQEFQFQNLRGLGC